jgi:ligand-binding SRPBCC domain-containing protein
MDWLSEVTVCETPQRFIYQQRVGPFAFWSHEVRLSESADGTLLEDIVFYRMPFGALGVLLHRLLIAGKLQQIFDTRRDYLQQRWG